MSDFFGRLAARVVAPERAIRPRMPSLFESFEEERGTRIDERGARNTEHGTPAPRVETHVVTGLAEPRVLETETVRELPREVAREVEEPTIVRENVHTPIAPALPPAPALLPAPPPGPPTPPAPRIETRTLVRERRTIERSERSERIERLRVHRQRQERHEVTRVAESAASPVEITIGRIDVRAVVGGAPASAAPRQREKPATMSLRDYLARRDERRRR